MFDDNFQSMKNWSIKSKKKTGSNIKLPYFLADQKPDHNIQNKNHYFVQFMYILQDRTQQMLKNPTKMTILNFKISMEEFIVLVINVII